MPQSLFLSELNRIAVASRKDSSWRGGAGCAANTLAATAPGRGGGGGDQGEGGGMGGIAADVWRCLCLVKTRFRLMHKPRL